MKLHAQEIMLLATNLKNRTTFLKFDNIAIENQLGKIYDSIFLAQHYFLQIQKLHFFFQDSKLKFSI